MPKPVDTNQIAREGEALASQHPLPSQGRGSDEVQGEGWLPPAGSLSEPGDTPPPSPLPSQSTIPLNTIQKSLLESQVIEAIREVYDPEIPVNVYDLGLIYDIVINDNASVDIRMTLTSPMCPVAEILPGQVEVAVRNAPGVTNAKVELTWDPPFSLDMVSEDVKLMLGLL